MNRSIRNLAAIPLLVAFLHLRGIASAYDPPVENSPAVPPDDSPTALAVNAEGTSLFVACATANQVAVFDTASSNVIGRIDVPASPLGLALSKDGARLFVACAAPTSTICVLDVATRRIIETFSAGHTAMAPVLSLDEKTLYVCNRFDDDISVIDLSRQRPVRRIRVEREPVAAAITPDGKFLVVANHLHAGTADHLEAQALVSVIDTALGQVAKKIEFTPGAAFLNGVAISPDGRFAAVTFVRAHYWLSTTEVELGRMNSSAVGVIDLSRLQTLGILLLDQTTSGAANPWAITWVPDGKTMVVSHAGTHELSLIDAPVEADPRSFPSLTLGAYFENAPRGLPAPPQHPVRVRQRVPLPGKGPRAMAVSRSVVYAANYFSDSLCRIDLASPERPVDPMPLGPAKPSSLVRQGNMWFNDASLCFQGWQSCASCHDTDARADGFNWDLLNDGLNNPKNTKSLLWAPMTPPAMSLGVRANSQVAVRAGLHHILFSQQTEMVPAAIDAYLHSLLPVPSPHLVDGHLSPVAERGKLLFMSPKTGCADCHPPPLFTDLATHDVGTSETFHGLLRAQAADKPAERFDTPTLVELWRTAPYLHTGSAATLQAVLTLKNRGDRHGRTSQLTPDEIDQLVEYLLSL